MNICIISKLLLTVGVLLVVIIPSNRLYKVMELDLIDEYVWFNRLVSIILAIAIEIVFIFVVIGLYYYFHWLTL
jgi:hypothetical protein